VFLQWEDFVITDISTPQIVNLVSKKEVKSYFFDRLNAMLHPHKKHGRWFKIPKPL